MPAMDTDSVAPRLLCLTRMLSVDECAVDWAAVLAAAVSLEQDIAPQAQHAELHSSLLVHVVSTAHMKLNEPREALAALGRHTLLASGQPEAARRELSARMAFMSRFPLSHAAAVVHTSAAIGGSAAGSTQGQSLAGCTDQQPRQPPSQPEITSNGRRALQLAAQLQDHRAGAEVAACLAEQFAAAGDDAAAAHSYGDCMATCASGAAAAVADWVVQLLIHVVPAAVDVHLSLGDPAGAREVLSRFNQVLLAAGRSAADECAVCYEQLTGSTPVTLLSCGHLFHRACCSEWVGHRLFAVGEFTAECPLCRAVDTTLQPSAAALEALEELAQHTPSSSSSGGSSDDGTSEEGDSSDADEGEVPAAGPAATRSRIQAAASDADSDAMSVSDASSSSLMEAAAIGAVAIAFAHAGGGAMLPEP